MIQLNKQDLKILNDSIKRLDITIVKYLKEYLNIDLKQGYTKGSYAIFKGDQIIDNKNCSVGIEIKNNLIVNYEIFTSKKG